MATTKKKTTRSKAKANKASTDSKNVKNTVTKIVESKRELKYAYPEGMKDTVERKKFRQRVRNRLYKFQRDIASAKGKAKKALERKYNSYRKDVLLVP